MIYKELFSDNEQISLESYMHKKGIIDTNAYLSHEYVEPCDKYKNIDILARSLINAIENDKIIYLLVDCDCDGYMSASMVYAYLHELYPNKVKLEPLFHDSQPKAHGLNDTEIRDTLFNENPSVLYITDAGTNDVKTCKQLSKLGWEILISDHHEFTCENPYATIVNNQTEGIENKALCGCGVTWKVLKKIDEIKGTSYARNYISYVWIANIGDSMEFTSCENETFRYWGKNNIHENLIPLIEEFNRDKDVDNKSFSFGMISKLNALIRVGTLSDKQLLFNCLSGGVNDKDTYKMLSNALKTCYNAQKSLKENLANNYTIITEKSVVVVYMDSKTPLTGLIANKLMGEYHKPVLVLHKSERDIAGSMRSPVPLREIFEQSGLFNYANGHDCSCGVGFKTDDEKKVLEYLDNLEVPPPMIEVLKVYKTKPSLDLFNCFPNECKYIWGKGIETPLVAVKDIAYASNNIQVLGKNQNTIKITVNDISYMFFMVSKERKEQLICKPKQTKCLEVVGELNINIYNGRKTNQIIVSNYDVKNINLSDLL